MDFVATLSNRMSFFFHVPLIVIPPRGGHGGNKRRPSFATDQRLKITFQEKECVVRLKRTGKMVRSRIQQTASSVPFFCLGSRTTWGILPACSHADDICTPHFSSPPCFFFFLFFYWLSPLNIKDNYFSCVVYSYLYHERGFDQIIICILSATTEKLWFSEQLNLFFHDIMSNKLEILQNRISKI